MTKLVIIELMGLETQAVSVESEKQLVGDSETVWYGHTGLRTGLFTPATPALSARSAATRLTRGEAD